MIRLIRKKDDKWIFQKNISSRKLIEAYLEVINNTRNFDKNAIKDALKKGSFYRGRSNDGSLSTMGLIFSKICFYMFVYK